MQVVLSCVCISMSGGLVQMEFRLIHCLVQYGATGPVGVAHEEFAARLADMPVTLRETA